MVYAYAIFLFFYATPTAIILGAMQGLWLYLERNRFSTARELILFETLSGAALGSLAFAPIFVQTNVILSWWAIGILLFAAIAGGLAAGTVNAWFFSSYVHPQTIAGHRRRFVTGCLIIFAFAVLEYFHYGPSIIRAVPVLKLSESSVLSLPSGDASGSRWAGCYQYAGDFKGSAWVGGEGGLMRFSQNDGRLEVYDTGHETMLVGGINVDGRFWAGTQRLTRDGGVWRFLLRGKFLDTDRFEYSWRFTLRTGGTSANTGRTVGSGYRVSC